MKKTLQILYLFMITSNACFKKSGDGSMLRKTSEFLSICRQSWMHKCFLSCLLTYINDDNTAMLDKYILTTLGEQMFMKQAKSYNDR